MVAVGKWVRFLRGGGGLHAWWISTSSSSNPGAAQRHTRQRQPANAQGTDPERRMISMRSWRGPGMVSTMLAVQMNSTCRVCVCGGVGRSEVSVCVWR